MLAIIWLTLGLLLCQVSPVHVLDAPHIEVVNDSIGQMIGGSAILECLVTGDEDPVLYWRRDDGQHPSSGGHPSRYLQTIEVESGTWRMSLSIVGLTAGDFDTYVCHAINAIGTAESRGQIVVYEITEAPPPGENEPPRIEVPSPEVGQELGMAAAMTCVITAYEVPLIYWLKDGETVTESLIKYITFEHQSEIHTWDASLHVIAITQDDLGNYTCQAVNGFGSAEERILLFNLDPVVQVQNPSMHAILGSDASLSCDVTAYPDPTFSWLKDGQILDTTGRYEPVVTTSDGLNHEMRLDITGVTRDDYGSYTCRVDTFYGVAQGEIVLNTDAEATEPPNHQLGDLPVLEVNADSVGQEQGRDTSLMCRVASEEAPLLLWYKDNEVLCESSKYQESTFYQDNGMVTMVLHILELTAEDFGVYHCMAANTAGSIQGDITLYELVSSPP